MSLHIRLFNDFWNHRKTAKLRSILGDDALWIMPRLWSYAAESQPDGDFGDYSSEQLAVLLGCFKHATSIRQALLDAGFMDSDGMLHNWTDRNGYHAEYASRAKKAAAARWGKRNNVSPQTPLPENEMEKKGKETSIASSMPQAYTLQNCLDAAASVGMPQEMVETFYNHYARVGFVTGTGIPITSLSHALAKWKADQGEHESRDKTKTRRKPSPEFTGGISPSAGKSVSPELQ